MKAINIQEPKVKGRVIIRVDFEFGPGDHFHSFGDVLAQALEELRQKIKAEPEDFDFSVHRDPPHVLVEVAPWVHSPQLAELIRQAVQYTEVCE